MQTLRSFIRLTRPVCGLAAVASLCFILAACGDTFRPIVIPNPTPGVDPGTQRTAVVLTQAPSGFSGTCAGGAIPPNPCPGVMMQINVSGDTNSSGFGAPGDLANYVVGAGPVAASFGVSFPQQLWVLNHDSDSVTQIVPSLGTQFSVALPAGAQPVAMTVTVDPTGAAANDLILTANAGSKSVTIVDAAARAARLTTATLPAAPVAIGAIPLQRKIYVARNDGIVSVLSTVDGSDVTTITLPAGADPVAIVAIPAISAVYVVNRGTGTVSLIDATTDTIKTDFPTGGPGANSIFFDSKALRVYVTNGAANTVTVLDASSINGGLLRPQPIALPAGASNPVAVTALPDGTRFYTANQDTNNVTVFDAQAFTPRSNIAVGTHPTHIAAAGDSSRVYVTNRDDTLDGTGAVVTPAGATIIRAVASTGAAPKPADTVVTTMTPPFVNPTTDPATCKDNPAACVHQQPVFVISQ